MNYLGRELNEYRANLHAHSTTSDGQFDPAQVIALYADAGYDVLAFTDHRKSNRISAFDSRGMTLISGMELHPAGPRGIRWHILGLGLPEDYLYLDPPSGQAAVDSVLAAGAIAFCAHPYWCGFTSAEVAALKGISGIEVYNTSTRYIGKEYNMQCWDELLSAGLRHTAIAVDDVHRLRDLFRGYTMILAEEKTPAALLSALKNGDFYASQGPRFTRIAVEGNFLRADFSPVSSAILIGCNSAGFCVGTEDFEGPGCGNLPISHLEYDLSSKFSPYWRIQLRDSAGRMAWSNPIFPGGPV